jgi:hypothetical protein
MATVDYKVLQAMSAISSWVDCSNANDHAIDRLAMPLNDAVNAHAFLDIAIFYKAHLTIRRTSLLSEDFLPVEI